MTVEFVSQVHVRDSSDLFPKPGNDIDVPFLRRYADALEEAGFDYTLVPYGSRGFSALGVADALSQLTERIKLIVALRPNILHPTAAAQALATLDQLSGGRALVHLISGGNQAEQARQGDFLTKAERYERTAEFITILRRAWTEAGPWSHDGPFFRFDDLVSEFKPVNGTIPISFGGSSPEAYRVGGALADIYGLWGEPLADTAEQIASITAGAQAAGRDGIPRIWVTFRPIIAPTEEQAWEKAHTILGALKAHRTGAAAPPPENAGSQRLLAAAAAGELHDRALWTPVAAATNAQGASTALVGTPETVAQAILDYVDLGASIVSIRGYDNLNDVVDYGRHLLPLVRAELARRADPPLVPSPPAGSVAVGV
ncbi:LLM class flavin-dependent oxidoreductase [Dactylosporangium fulvum]|uniref:LLM class flavin-dependent oxidoreductase n=1 Tax=Dactylosporangium fulvum TaxID=53359 RepID=A0ABY5VSY0_9ACTN|nr:LLM class flavin-dependent oxidoreductase [Dactylosporangium fulvum]UWP78926.1 LLM class flavin-dependent oxidoreductase [Dactylosporangium fulvum]